MTKGLNKFYLLVALLVSLFVSNTKVMAAEYTITVDNTQDEINEFSKNYDSKLMEEKLKKIIKRIVENRELKKEDIQQLVNKIEIDKDKNVLIHFNFYELNCIGGYFKYDNTNKQAVNS